MCDNPNSPNPQAFRCMRIWAIISIVFGILCVLGALQQIQPMSAPPPCWICPDGGVDSTAYASSWCRGRRGQPIGGTTCLETDFANTFCGPRSVTDSAGCSSAGGDWIESYCGEVNAYWASNVRGGSSECAVLQASPQLSACCIPGDPPPSGGNWVALMLFIFNLLLAICKISGGGVLSCCGGQPSEGKMKSAMGFAALSILIEIGGTARARARAVAGPFTLPRLASSADPPVRAYVTAQ